MMLSNALALVKIKAMLNGEGIDFMDKPRALASIAETVLPTKLTKIYLAEIGRLNRLPENT